MGFVGKYDRSRQFMRFPSAVIMVFLLIGIASSFALANEGDFGKALNMADNTVIATPRPASTAAEVKPIVEVVRDEIIENGVKIIVERPTMLRISRPNEPSPNPVKIYVAPVQTFTYGSLFASHLRGGVGLGMHFPPTGCFYTFLELWVKFLRFPWKLVWQRIYNLKGFCPEYPPLLVEGKRIFVSVETLREESADLSKLSIGEEKLVGEYNVYVLAEDEAYALLPDKFTDRAEPLQAELGIITRTLTTTITSISTYTTFSPILHTMTTTVTQTQIIASPSITYATTTERITITQPITATILTTITAGEALGVIQMPSEQVLVLLVLAAIIVVAFMLLIITARAKRAPKIKTHVEPS